MSWSREQVQVLIEEYYKKPCLYATRTPLYKSRHARTAAMAQIVAAVQKVRPGVTDAEIKCKFNGLRTNFMIEYRKYEASEKSAQGQDEIYHPTVWYYKHMKFLLEHTLPKRDIMTDSEWNGEADLNISDPLINEIPICEAGIKVEECTFEDLVQEMKTPATSECSTPCNVQSSTHPMTFKRKRLDNDLVLNDFPEVTKTISSTIHEHTGQNLPVARPTNKTNEDLFGEYVASKMKLISNPDIHLSVEEEVTQVLFRGLRKCRET